MSVKYFRNISSWVSLGILSFSVRKRISGSLSNSHSLIFSNLSSSKILSRKVIVLNRDGIVLFISSLIFIIEIISSASFSDKNFAEILLCFLLCVVLFIDNQVYNDVLNFLYLLHFFYSSSLSSVVSRFFCSFVSRIETWLKDGNVTENARNRIAFFEV